MPLERNPHVAQIIDVVLESAKLANIYRYFGHRYWEEETRDNKYAAGAESKPRLESVADHSWHLADMVLIIAPEFKYLDINKCLAMAILHDKLELFTGDDSPVGKYKKDTPGQKTHAFNLSLRRNKTAKEFDALFSYSNKLNKNNRLLHEELLEDLLLLQSQESRFIKALDRIQTLTFIIRKKGGTINLKHLRFTLQYTKESINFFPDIEPYYYELVRRLIRLKAKSLGDTENAVFRRATEFQMSLMLPVSGAATTHGETDQLDREIRIALFGKTGAGKTSIARFLNREFGFSIVSTGKRCRQIANEYFQSEAKTILNKITDSFRLMTPGIWLKMALLDVPSDSSRVIIDSIRFPEDYEYVRQHGFKIWKINCNLEVRLERLKERGQEYNPEIDEVHAAEMALDDYSGMTEVKNNEDGIENMLNDIRKLLNIK